MTTEGKLGGAARLTDAEREEVYAIVGFGNAYAYRVVELVERLTAEREKAAFAGFMRALLAARVVCPVHGIPDCGPLLNGCSIPRHIAEWRGEFMGDLRAALAP